MRKFLKISSKSALRSLGDLVMTLILLIFCIVSISCRTSEYEIVSTDDSVVAIDQSITYGPPIVLYDEKYEPKYVELEANNDIWDFPEWFYAQEPDPPVKQSRTIRVCITHYCPCSKCCGAYSSGYTATGAKAIEGVTIAVDPRVIPYGSEVVIKGHTYTAEDTGVSGNHIDIFVESHEKALQLGMYYTDVEVFDP